MVEHLVIAGLGLATLYFWRAARRGAAERAAVHARLNDTIQDHARHADEQARHADEQARMWDAGERQAARMRQEREATQALYTYLAETMIALDRNPSRTAQMCWAAAMVIVRDFCVGCGMLLAEDGPARLVHSRRCRAYARRRYLDAEHRDPDAHAGDIALAIAGAKVI